MPIISGCSEYPSPSTFPSHLMVNYTAKTEGALFPCGCRIPIGGLSRRGGVINTESPYPQLTVDAGSFSGGSTGYDRFAAGWILQAYALMGYHAANLGRRESIQPVSQLREWDSMSGGILISANLLDEHDLPVTRTHLVREIGGIRIGITGITSQGNRPQGATEMPEIILPVPPLFEVMEKFTEEQVDFVVLLADTSSLEVNAILNEIPGIDLVILGQEFNSSQVPASEIFEGGSRMVKIGGIGKYLGRMRIDFEPDGTVTGDEVMRIDLDSTTPTLSSISLLMTDFKLELRERRDEFMGDPTNPFQRSQAPEMVDILVGYTGSGFCVKCHVGYGFEQQMIGHTDTWYRLTSGQQTDPACLKCHSTGYGVPTGMIDPYKESHLRGVTCEACHGPAAEHVIEMTADKEGYDLSELLPSENPTGIQFSREVSESRCLECHTSDRPCFDESQPEFDYRTWLERISHESGKNRPQIVNPETGERTAPDISSDDNEPEPE